MDYRRWKREVPRGQATRHSACFSVEINGKITADGSGNVYRGGASGGSIRITSDKSIKGNGYLSVKGGDAAYHGGSGGRIYISGQTISGSLTTTAEGGASNKCCTVRDGTVRLVEKN